jgi:hypothetical protein
MFIKTCYIIRRAPKAGESMSKSKTKNFKDFDRSKDLEVVILIQDILMRKKVV